MPESPPAAAEINGGKREEMEDTSTQGKSTNTKGKDEQINNTTLQLTGTLHQGTSKHFTNNTYFPVSKRQGDKWQAQRSQRKCVMILRIKSRPYSPVSGLIGSTLHVLHPSQASHPCSFNQLRSVFENVQSCPSSREHRIPKPNWNLKEILSSS